MVTYYCQTWFQCNTGSNYLVRLYFYNCTSYICLLCIPHNCDILYLFISFWVHSIVTYSCLPKLVPIQQPVSLFIRNLWPSCNAVCNDTFSPIWNCTTNLDFFRVTQKMSVSVSKLKSVLLVRFYFLVSEFRACFIWTLELYLSKCLQTFFRSSCIFWHLSTRFCYMRQIWEMLAMSTWFCPCAFTYLPLVLVPWATFWRCQNFAFVTKLFFAVKGKKMQKLLKLLRENSALEFSSQLLTHEYLSSITWPLK